MSNEYLIKKLQTIVELSPDQLEAAYQFLIKSIVVKIKNFQVLKIQDLGFFQLKNEPLTRQERKNSSEKSINKQYMVYVPFVKDENALDKLFINLEIEDFDLFSNENVDKAFSIGFNKLTIPLSGRNVNSFAKKVKDFSVKNNFEDKIADLLNSAEIIDDFNIFTDYLGSAVVEDLKPDEVLDTVREVMEVAQSDTPAFEESETEEISKSLESNIEQTDELKLTTDFTEDDIEKLFSNEELEKISLVDENTKDETKIENENLIGNENEDASAEVLDLTESKIEFEDETPAEESDNKKKTMFDELEEVLNSDSESKEIIEALNSEEKSAEAFSSLNNSSDESENKNENIKSSAFYKSFIFWFFVIFVIVLAAVILILNQNIFQTSKKSVQKKSLTKKTETVQSKKAVEKIILPPSNDSVKEKVRTETEQKIIDPNLLYRTPAKDVRINNQVYFDGIKYSVQLSSWLNKSIAENEVKKLRARGYDAYIYKAFVQSKGSMWSRVRIGYFKSADEANQFLINNQLKE